MSLYYIKTEFGMLDFLWKPCCKHDKISPQSLGGYCPDCGELVQNHWYMTRCSCCGNKQKTVVRNGKIVSIAKFCPNCGNKEFSAERLETIDIVNINYATVIKKTIEFKKQNYIQSWIENNNYTPKLLPSY